MEFQEEEALYKCTGYTFAHSSVNGQLKRFLVGKGEENNNV
ncbi:hypothetical protein bcere0022_28610 [Bacillus cereus Rock3-44]|nr:hypothetical protein bcere0022_28610 [Bacillus cereus Rock3-44]